MMPFSPPQNCAVFSFYSLGQQSSGKRPVSLRLVLSSPECAGQKRKRYDNSGMRKGDAPSPCSLLCTELRPTPFQHASGLCISLSAPCQALFLLKLFFAQWMCTQATSFPFSAGATLCWCSPQQSPLGYSTKQCTCLDLSAGFLFAFSFRSHSWKSLFWVF